MNMTLSPVASAQFIRHGGNFSVHRLALERLGELIHPIMGFDHFVMGGPTFAPHPHAGFSAITYVFEDSRGGMRNRDSLGHDHSVQPGELVWTQAGRGVIHDEFPATPGASVHGLQLFVNLSARNKHLAPEVFHIAVPSIPTVTDALDNRTRVLAGSFGGVTSPMEAAEPFDFFDVTVRGEWSWQVPAGRSALVYVLDGKVKVVGSDGQEQSLEDHEALGVRVNGADGEALRLQAGAGAHVLVLSGVDPQEPIAVYGPFIMNSESELAQAYERYQTGQMGRLTQAAA
jgi:redox-sensitive bicupin YhaK (pirin superfamily)